MSKMDIEKTERERIDKCKEREKREAEEAMYDTFAKLKQDGKMSTRDEDTSDATTEPQDKFSSGKDIKKDDARVDDVVKSRSKEDPKSLPISKVSLNINADDSGPQIQEEFEQKRISAPRQAVKATIKHTPRIFKTPSRESTVAQETAFIAKNRPYLRKNRLLNTDGLSISEAEPTWLQGKGEECLRNGDYASAVQAYTAALDIDNSLVSALISRSLCFFKLSDWERCISDTSRALNLHSSRCDENQRAILHKWRGFSLCHSKKYEDALIDFESTIGMIGTKNELQLYIENIKKIIEANKLKSKADYLVTKSQYHKALDLYDRCTTLVPRFIDALANKSACYFGLNLYEDCICTCTTILDVLLCHKKVNYEKVIDCEDVFLALLPPLGSTERKLYCARQLSRRGVANIHLHRFDNAIQDLRKALTFLEKNSKEWIKLKMDIDKLEKDHAVDDKDVVDE